MEVWENASVCAVDGHWRATLTMPVAATARYRLFKDEKAKQCAEQCNACAAHSSHKRELIWN